MYGYYRINRERTLAAARSRGLGNPTQLAKALAVCDIGEATFFRSWTDQQPPGNRLIFALRFVLDARFDEIFDPVTIQPGQQTPATSD